MKTLYKETISMRTLEEWKSINEYSEQSYEVKGNDCGRRAGNFVHYLSDNKGDPSAIFITGSAFW